MSIFHYFSATQLIYNSLLGHFGNKNLRFEENCACAMCAGPLFEVENADPKSLLPDVDERKVNKIIAAVGSDRLVFIPAKAVVRDSFVRGFEVRPFPTADETAYICLACTEAYSASGSGGLLTMTAIFATRDRVSVLVSPDTPAWERFKSRYPKIHLCPDPRAFVSAVLEADPASVGEYGLALAVVDQFRTTAKSAAGTLTPFEKNNISHSNKGVSPYLVRLPVGYDLRTLVFAYDGMLGWVPADAVREAYVSGMAPDGERFPAPAALFLEAVAAAGLASRRKEGENSGRNVR